MSEYYQIMVALFKFQSVNNHTFGSNRLSCFAGEEKTFKKNDYGRKVMANLIWPLKGDKSDAKNIHFCKRFNFIGETYF